LAREKTQVHDSLERAPPSNANHAGPDDARSHRASSEHARDSASNVDSASYGHHSDDRPLKGTRSIGSTSSHRGIYRSVAGIFSVLDVFLLRARPPLVE
jgi:hypothetical protein